MERLFSFEPDFPQSPKSTTILRAGLWSQALLVQAVCPPASRGRLAIIGTGSSRSRTRGYHFSFKYLNMILRAPFAFTLRLAMITYFFGHTQSMRKFWGPGSNPWHSSDLSHSSDNDVSHQGTPMITFFWRHYFWVELFTRPNLQT